MKQEFNVEQIEALLEKMTLSEKVSMLSGRDPWHTVRIERLGIPSIVFTDGPHGVRTGGEGFDRKVGTATAFPTGVSIASTWNRDLVENLGVALGEETRHLGCHVLLGPCVNIVRSPLGGRNFETYSEDPYLAGQIGVAYVKGVQSQGIGASVKHFAANNQEYERFRGNSVVDERTLREIYLPAFETIVREAKPWTVMCSYNRINGFYASVNEILLREILKEAWGFDGVVVSDWGAVHDIYHPIKAGLDLEMPGPTRYFGQALETAVSNWQIDQNAIDDAVRRMLRLISRAAGDDQVEGSGDSTEHRQVARDIAAESMVLLKNSSRILPLKREKIRKLAVIGLNADCVVSGGGSSRLESPYWVTPLAGLKAKLGGSIDVVYETGYDNRVDPKTVASERFTHPDGVTRGLKAEYFNSLDFVGEPVLERVDANVDHWWVGVSPQKGVVSEKHYSVRWTGTFTAPDTGETEFCLKNTGDARVWLDGMLMIENGPGVVPHNVIDTDKIIAHERIKLEKGKEYEFKATFVSGEDNPFALIHFSYLPPLGVEGDLVGRAVRLAKSSDAAIIVAGLPDSYESEGRDRPDMKLTGAQDPLIRAVAKANPNTVVLINAGAPVEMPWMDEVGAVLLTYYPGQEGGHALADIIFGDVNPSGKLTVTYPKRLEDNPAYIHYPGGRDVHYGERFYVGYRYYDTKRIEPLFPFGHGLSYTEFNYSELALPQTVKRNEQFQVTVTVENTGGVFGKEVIQLYIRDLESSVLRPLKELKAFEKVGLAPGESTIITFNLDTRALSYFDDHVHQWVAEKGMFEVLVGASSEDIRLRGIFELV